MGRPRGFDEDDVLRRAAQVFAERGYEGTSVDDLVGALDLHRGSLYKAFGSKRGLFLATLDRHVARAVRRSSRGDELDLVLVAAVELGPRDPEVAAQVRSALAVVGRRALTDRLVDRLVPDPTENRQEEGRA